MKKILASVLTASSLLAFGWGQVAQADGVRYSYAVGKGYVNFYGPDGNLQLFPYVGGPACKAWTRDFGRVLEVLDQDQNGYIWFQTYNCFDYITVCIDVNDNRFYFDPQVCYSGPWRRL
jgi:hypothetical protein